MSWFHEPARAFARAGGVLGVHAIALALLGSIARADDSAAGGGGARANPGDTVGVFELGAPAVAAFTLHGTLPVPPGIFPGLPDQSVFQVRDADGTLVHAQTEIVSRYPATNDGADVVEIIARVHAPSGTVPGDRLRYDIVYEPYRVDRFFPHPAVDALLSAPGSVVMRAGDVFGHRYSADLLADWRGNTASMRVLKDGSEEFQVATHVSLFPEHPQQGPEATLLHFMGVHSYVTEWAGEPFFTLDLRVHNAHSGLAQNDSMDDALGKLYFDALELVLPPGWTVFNAFPDPYTGDVYADHGQHVWPIVAPIDGRKLHVMPAMSQFHRRLVVVRSGFEARALSCLREEGLGFCRAGTSRAGAPLWSWWNDETARYFPQRHRLPSLDYVGLDQLRASDMAVLGLRAEQVRTGSTGPWPTEGPGLGWAHPWGIAPGYMVSGLEINIYEGVTTACAASNAGYRTAQLIHRMLSDRQPNVLFDADGRPTRLEEWLIHGQESDILPIWWFGGPLLWAADPFGITTSPSFQRDAVAARGERPDWEPALDGFEFIDQAHLIRYTRMAKVLAWLGNDAIAKDDLRAQAEGIRMAYSMYPQNFYQQGAISTGMFVARRNVDQHPGWGFPFGRADGWGVDVVCASYSLGDPTWRATVRPWFDLVVDLVRDGQSDCTGIIQATSLGNIFNAKYRCRQSIEEAIVQNALVEIRESAFQGQSPGRVAEVNAILQLSIRAMISPLVWDDTLGGPWAMIAVGPIDQNQPPYCTFWPHDGNYGITDHYQIWSSFAYAYEITHDQIFLSRATEALGGGNLAVALQAGGIENIQNKAALIALVQQL
jgi:hypothetical protein